MITPTYTRAYELNDNQLHLTNLRLKKFVQRNRMGNNGKIHNNISEDDVEDNLDIMTRTS